LVVSKVLFSSKKQDWGTPPELFKELSKEFGPFRLDAATRESNPLNTLYFYTEKDDGLKQPWMNPTYVNPPYGRGIYNWVKKAHDEQQFGIGTVMLIPARTDTRWFHEFIYKNRDVQVRFLKGRLKMYNYDTKEQHQHLAPFPSMVVVFYSS